MTRGVKQDDVTAACSMIRSLRVYAKKRYAKSKVYVKYPCVGDDDNFRVVTNPLRISHYFKEVEVDGSEVVEVIETVLNPKNGEYEDKVVHHIDGVVVFKMDGSEGMNSPKKNGWQVECISVGCRGLRYRTKSISPQKNKKLVCHGAHAQDMYNRHLELVRRGG